MTTESTESVTTRRRPKSTRAQTVTACASVLLVVIFIGTLSLGWGLISAIGHGSSKDAPSAVSQWLCLPYTQFVLEQHRAGLTPEQIAAALEVSEYGDRGQLGVTQPAAEITTPRLDSTEACGLPFEILSAAAQLVPSGPPSP